MGTLWQTIFEFFRAFPTRPTSAQLENCLAEGDFLADLKTNSPSSKPVYSPYMVRPANLRILPIAPVREKCDDYKPGRETGYQDRGTGKCAASLGSNRWFGAQRIPR